MKQILLGMGIMTVLLLTVGGALAAFQNNGDGTLTFGYTLTTVEGVELRDAMCHNYKYQDTVRQFNEITGEDEEIPNPEDCNTFAWKQGKKYFQDNVKAYRHYQATQAIDLGTDPTVN